jgi:hypothetical protein
MLELTQKHILGFASYLCDNVLILERTFMTNDY